jgi:hypothetical protein
MNVKINLDTANQMLAKRGLIPTGQAQKFFTMTCAKEMDPYVPMQQGTLKNTRIIGQDTVKYNTPYAKFQFHGKVMIAPSGSTWARKGERKEATIMNLTYHGAPKRGFYWERRMWADKKVKVLRQVAAYVGGRAVL